MLATICETWAGECVRAFFAYGISALTGRCSIAEATAGPIVTLFDPPLRLSRAKKRTGTPGTCASLGTIGNPYPGRPVASAQTGSSAHLHFATPPNTEPSGR